MDFIEVHFLTNLLSAISILNGVANHVLEVQSSIQDIGALKCSFQLVFTHVIKQQNEKTHKTSLTRLNFYF